MDRWWMVGQTNRQIKRCLLQIQKLRATPKKAPSEQDYTAVLWGYLEAPLGRSVGSVVREVDSKTSWSSNADTTRIPQRHPQTLQELPEEGWISSSEWHWLWSPRYVPLGEKGTEVRAEKTWAKSWKDASSLGEVEWQLATETPSAPSILLCVSSIPLYW